MSEAGDVCWGSINQNGLEKFKQWFFAVLLVQQMPPGQISLAGVTRGTFECGVSFDGTRKSSSAEFTQTRITWLLS